MTLKKVLSTAQFAAGGIVLARCVGSRKGKGRWGGRNGCVGFVLDVSWWRYLQSSTLHFNVARLVHDVHVVLYARKVVHPTTSYLVHREFLFWQFANLLAISELLPWPAVWGCCGVGDAFLSFERSRIISCCTWYPLRHHRQHYNRNRSQPSLCAKALSSSMSKPPKQNMSGWTPRSVAAAHCSSPQHSHNLYHPL